MGKKRIVSAATVLAGTLLAVLVAEAAVRLLAPRAILVPSQDDVNGITAMRPNVHGRNAAPGIFDTTISTNGQRFRGSKNYSERPGPGVWRIAAIGDSFTFGGGANDDETYPARLERLLPPGVEVINAGIPGTGTGEQALWYDAWVSRFHPQVVILTVVSNDVNDDFRKPVFLLDSAGRASPRAESGVLSDARHERRARGIVNAIPGYSFLAQHSQLLGLARFAGSRLIGRPWRTSGEGSSAAPGLPVDGFALLRGEVLWLCERVVASGARLAVLYVPFRESVYPNGPSDVAARQYEDIGRTLGEICSQQQIPFSDVTPALREEAARSSRRLYYPEPEFHPTPEGYRVIAESAAALLARSGLVRVSDR